MKKYFVLLLFFFFIHSLLSAENDQLLADKIVSLLKIEYDNVKDKSWIEKIILQMGKSTYMDSLEIWKANYFQIEKIKIVLHPKLENMAQVGDLYLDLEKKTLFRKNLSDLTFIAYKNINIYFLAIKKYRESEPTPIDQITIKTLDAALYNPEFSQKKRDLYEEERSIKKSLRVIMHDKKIKYKLGIYIFAFDFFNKIREKVIEKDIKEMDKRLLNSKQ